MDFGDFAGFGSVWAISVKRNDEEMGHDIFQTFTCQNGETKNKKVYVPKVYVLFGSPNKKVGFQYRQEWI